MKKYVFSHISLFDYVLTSKVIESDLSALNVAIQELANQGWDMEDGNFTTMENLKCFAFDCNSMIEIIEV